MKGKGSPLSRGMVPDPPRSGGWYVCDGAVVQVDVEAQQAHVLDGFQLDGVAKKVR